MAALAPIAVAALLLAWPPRAEAATCSAATAPTARSAWRAHVPAGTPVRRRLDSPATRAQVTGSDGWLLALRSARARDGTCRIQVRLTVRPNTATGWIAAARASVRHTPWRLVVSRARRTVSLLRLGNAVARWHAVVGTARTPTPTGLFAIRGVFSVPSGNFLGRWVLTLSAHSDVLQTFDGGDGRVALHGRGGTSLLDPLGSAASHGCVRLDDRAIGQIVHRVGRRALPGVPVIVR